jgi:hypothetical protein
MRTSLHEKLHFLRGQEAEHAAHTARLSQIMAGRSTAPERVCVMPRQIMLGRMRVAYMTGWSDGVRIGLAWGVIFGFAMGFFIVALGAGSLQ